MDITRYQELAYSHHKEILVEIVTEINTVDSVVRDASIDFQSFRPEIQYAFRHMAICKRETEGLAATIDLQEKKVEELNKNPAIQRILDLEQELKSSLTPQFTNQLSREIRHLKSIHSQKISARVSIQRQLLQDRLRMVRIWKSVLSDEIQILDESKKLLVDKIVALTEYSNDPSLREMVKEQIKNITGEDIKIPNNKFDASKVQVANIHVLRETLRQQLNDVARIESVVAEKREKLKTLSRIIAEMEHQSDPASPQPEPSQATSNASPQKNSPQAPHVDEAEVPERKPSRMVLRERRDIR